MDTDRERHKEWMNNRYSDMKWTLASAFNRDLHHGNTKDALYRLKAASMMFPDDDGLLAAFIHNYKFYLEHLNQISDVMEKWKEVYQKKHREDDIA